jgi:hypothetical protein
VTEHHVLLLTNANAAAENGFPKQEEDWRLEKRLTRWQFFARPCRGEVLSRSSLKEQGAVRAEKELTASASVRVKTLNLGKP